MFARENISPHRKPGKRSFRRVGRIMANNKRGPEPGSQKAKRGGQAVREKYGPEFYSRIGKKGGETVKEKRGPKFYAEIGKKGGESTKRQQGSAFYSKIGKKGGEHGRAVAADKEGRFIGSGYYFKNGGVSTSSTSNSPSSAVLSFVLGVS